MSDEKPRLVLEMTTTPVLTAALVTTPDTPLARVLQQCARLEEALRREQARNVAADTRVREIEYELSGWGEDLEEIGNRVIEYRLRIEALLQQA